MDRFPPIRDLAAIGDGRSVAVIDREGTVVWLCAPRLDSPSLFGALLDPERGGDFALHPSIPFTTERRYLPHTNVLETRFRTAKGMVRVLDAFTLGDSGLLSWRELARSVKGLSGEVPMEWSVRPRFDHGQVPAAFEPYGDRAVTKSEQGTFALSCFDAGEMKIHPERARGEFTLRAGHEALLAWSGYGDEPMEMPPRAHIEARLQQTIRHWRRWAEGMRYSGEWKMAVERSALALALVSDPESGAIAAAPTTSLPEKSGGKRNWDYRFCWSRDMSFALDALMALGFREQATRSLRWLLHALEGTRPRIHPVYGLDGGILREQQKLPLAGYESSQPVWAGNEASTQVQLGAYGDLFATVGIYSSEGNLLGPRAGQVLAEVADHLCGDTWLQVDSGIWELPTKRHYTVSKMGCWVTMDRAIQLAEAGKLPKESLPRWRVEREAIRGYIEHECWSEERQAWTQAAGTDNLDAACLLAARSGYAPPGDPRLASTLDAVRRELSAGPLLYRYGGMREKEGAFLACSFWGVDALVRLGRFDEAADWMDALIPLSNDLGLFSEEMDPGSGAMLGNFPQALTHLTLINAAAGFQAERERASTRGGGLE